VNNNTHINKYGNEKQKLKPESSRRANVSSADISDNYHSVVSIT